MAKYSVGDKFICEVTEVDDGGMGNLYILNSKVMIAEKDLENLEYVKPSPVREDKVSQPKKTAHTPAELRERIFQLSKLLAESIENYQRIMTAVNENVETIDNVI